MDLSCGRILHDVSLGERQTKGGRRFLRFRRWDWSRRAAENKGVLNIEVGASARRRYDAPLSPVQFLPSWLSHFSASSFCSSSSVLTLCNSFEQGGSSYQGSHLHPLSPNTQPLTSPALAAQQRAVASPSASPVALAPPHQSLSKANPLSPGRRASMVSHGGSSPTGGVATLELGGRGPGMSRLTIVRAPSRGAEGNERRVSTSHGSDSGHHRR